MLVAPVRAAAAVELARGSVCKAATYSTARATRTAPKVATRLIRTPRPCPCPTVPRATRGAPVPSRAVRVTLRGPGLFGSGSPGAAVRGSQGWPVTASLDIARCGCVPCCAVPCCAAVPEEAAPDSEPASGPVSQAAGAPTSGRSRPASQAAGAPASWPKPGPASQACARRRPAGVLAGAAGVLAILTARCLARSPGQRSRPSPGQSSSPRSPASPQVRASPSPSPLTGPSPLRWASWRPGRFLRPGPGPRCHGRGCLPA